MTCLKCNKEIPYDHNLCGYCGNPLREKCSECGEMELLGRVVCEKKLRETLQKKEAFISRALPGDYSLMLGLFGTLLIGIGIIMIRWLTEKSTSSSSAVATSLYIVVSFIILFWIANRMHERRLCIKEKLTNDFFRLHPEYAEIIKKAEGEEK